MRRVDDDERRLARAPDRPANDGSVRALAPAARLRVAVVLLRVALELVERHLQPAQPAPPRERVVGEREHRADRERGAARAQRGGRDERSRATGRAHRCARADDVARERNHREQRRGERERRAHDGDERLAAEHAFQTGERVQALEIGVHAGHVQSAALRERHGAPRARGGDGRHQRRERDAREGGRNAAAQRMRRRHRARP